MEAALSIYLENFATTLGSREQLAIAEVADALLVIPKALAVNAAKDATELVNSSGLWFGIFAWQQIAGDCPVGSSAWRCLETRILLRNPFPAARCSCAEAAPYASLQEAA